MAGHQPTSTLIRSYDWQSLLHQFLLERRYERFAYGRMDCCLFVADAIRVMTGVDLAQSFRGLYGSQREAMAAIKAYAGKASVKAVAEAVSRDFGLPTIPVLAAHRGDMVLIKRSCDYSLGLVHLNGREVVVSASAGLGRIPLLRAARAWQI